MKKRVGVALYSSTTPHLPGREISSPKLSVEKKYVVEMEKRMQTLTDQKRQALRSVPKMVPAMVMMLQLPNVSACLKKVSCSIDRLRLMMGFNEWFRVTRITLKILHSSARVIQSSWKMDQEKKMSSKKLQEAEAARVRKLNHAAEVVQVFMKAKVFSLSMIARFVRRMSAKRLRSAILIQSCVRGYLCRGHLADEERLSVVKELKQWAHGGSHKLLINPYLQDNHNQELLHRLIHFSSLPSRPLWRLPSHHHIRHARNQMHAVRNHIDGLIDHKKAEYTAMMRESKAMADEDRLSLLIEKTIAADEAQVRRKIAEKEMQKKRERLETLRRNRRRTAMSMLMSLEEAAVYEKAEREIMFREDYTLRRFYDAIKAAKFKTMERDREMMVQEDLRSRQLRAMERERSEWERAMEVEAARAVEAKILTSVPFIRTITSDIPQGTSLSLSAAAVSIEVTSAVPMESKADIVCSPHVKQGLTRRWKEAAVVPKSERWSTYVDIQSIAAALSGGRSRIAVRLRQLEPTTAAKRHRTFSNVSANSSTAGSVNAMPSSLAMMKVVMHPGSRATGRCDNLEQFKAARIARRAGYRSLCEVISSFNSMFLKLLKIRLELRVGKQVTRLQRQGLLSTAVELETKLQVVQEKIVSSTAVLRDCVKTESQLHMSLLFGAESDPLRDADVDDEEEQARLEELRQSALRRIQAQTSSRDSGASKAKRSAFRAPVDLNVLIKDDTPSTPAKTVAATPKPKRGVPSTPVGASSPGALPGPAAEGLVEHFWNMLGLPPEEWPPLPPRDKAALAAAAHAAAAAIKPGSLSRKKIARSNSPKTYELGTKARRKAATSSKGATNKANDSAAADKPKEVRSLAVPGLVHYLVSKPTELDFFEFGCNIRDWSVLVVRWMEEREDAWRSRRWDATLSYLQRLLWLITTSYALLEEEAARSFLKNRYTATSSSSSSSSSSSRVSMAKAAEAARSMRLAVDTALNSDECLVKVISTAKQLSIEDLYLLLISRVDLSLEAREVEKFFSIRQLDLHSGKCDSLFGVHPASLHGLLLNQTNLEISLSASVPKRDMTVDFKSIIHPLLTILQSLVHSKILRSPFDSPKLTRSAVMSHRDFTRVIVKALDVERSGVHELITELASRDMLHLIKEEVDLAASAAAHSRTPGTPAALQSKARKVAAARRPYFHLLSSVTPTHFIRTRLTPERWDLAVPSWQCPVYRWGQVAEEEPFWRRLHMERVQGIRGPYTIIDEKDECTDNVARGLIFELWTRMMCRRDDLDQRRAAFQLRVDREMMEWEDALAVGQRQRLRAQVMAELERKRQAQLGCLKSLFDSLPSSKGARIAITTKTMDEQWHLDVLKRPPPRQKCLRRDLFATRMNYSTRTSLATLTPHTKKVLLDSRDRLTGLRRKKSWLTGQAVYFDADGKHTAKDAVAAATQSKDYRPLSEEMWCCGGLRRVLVACRVVENSQLNPRGRLRTSIFTTTQYSDNPNLLASGTSSSSSGQTSYATPPVLLASRTGFASVQKVCEDGARGSTFASHQAASGRYLSARAFHRLQREFPSIELPRVEALVAMVWREIVMSRYGSVEAERAVVAMQCMYRTWKACKVVSKLRGLRSVASRQSVLMRGTIRK